MTKRLAKKGLQRRAANLELTKDYFMTEKYRSVLLFGQPGVGKGTQGKILGNIPGFFHLSVGDVFRSIDIGSEDGRLIYEFSSQGKLVPDELTVSIWKKALNAYVALSRYKPREDLLVLDGIPRNVAQTELVKDHLDIRQIVHLKGNDEEEMIHRMRRRAIRENRPDDANEEVVRHRFQVYRDISAPVLDCYPKNKISEVSAIGSPAEVLQQILNCMIPTQNELFHTADDA